MRAVVETHDVFDATGIVMDLLPKVSEDGNGQQGCGQNGDADRGQQTKAAGLTHDSAAPSFLHHRHHFWIAHDSPSGYINYLTLIRAFASIACHDLIMKRCDVAWVVPYVLCKRSSSIDLPAHSWKPFHPPKCDHSAWIHSQADDNHQ